MHRRLFVLMLLSLSLSAGAAELLLPQALQTGAALADNDRDNDRDSDRGGDDGGGRSGDDGGSDDGGSDDGGDDGGSDDGGGDDGGDDGNDNSGSGGSDDDGGDDDGASSGSSGGSGSGIRASGSKAKGLARAVGAAGVRRFLADGSRERLIGTTYERFDPRGRRVERRRASPADLARMGRMTGARAVIIVRDDRIEVTDSAGWHEEIRGGKYRLTDPRGNLVTRRPATTDDLARIRDALDEN